MLNQPTQPQVDIAIALLQSIIVATPFYMAAVRYITNNIREYDPEKAAISEIDVFSWVNASCASWIALLLSVYEIVKFLLPVSGTILLRTQILIGILLFSVGWAVLGPMIEAARDSLDEKDFLRIGSGILIQGILILIYVSTISPPPVP